MSGWQFPGMVLRYLQGRAFRSVQRQDGSNQHFESFPGNDGMRYSGGNQEAFSLGQTNFFIAYGEVCRPVQNLYQRRTGRLVGGEELFAVKGQNGHVDSFGAHKGQTGDLPFAVISQVGVIKGSAFGDVLGVLFLFCHTFVFVIRPYK